MIPYELHLASRYLRFHRGRTFISLITLISIAGVMVGTAALVIAMSLMNGFVEDFRARILGEGAHLRLHNKEKETLAIDPATLEVVERAAGVEAAAPVLFSHGMLVGPAGRQAYTEIYGVDPERQGAVLGADAATREALAALAAPGESGRAGIVLGAPLAENLGVEPGDHVRAVVPRVTLSPFAPLPKTRTYEVVGTFRLEALGQDAQRSFIEIAEAGSLLGAKGELSHIDVRVTDFDRLEPIQGDLRETLAGEWWVIDVLEAQVGLVKALNQERLYLFLAIWLIVVVAALNIVSTLVLLVTDKVKDIGILSAMGAQPSGIAVLFLIQGLVIGAIGTVAGLVLGAGLSWWFDAKQIIELDPEVYFLTHVRFVVAPLDLVRAGFVAMGTALVATLYPALRAARQKPVEALRYE